MKKINYKLVAALAITMLVGLTSSLVLADDAADAAHPDKTHQKDDSKKTTTVTQSKKTEDKKTEDKKTEDKKTEDKKTEDKKTEDKPAEHRQVVDPTRPEVHDASHRDTHYSHDNQGWYDEGHQRHDFITYRGERGYWDYVNGQPVFVSIGSSAVIQIHL